MSTVEWQLQNEVGVVGCWCLKGGDYGAVLELILRPSAHP